MLGIYVGEFPLTSKLAHGEVAGSSAPPPCSPDSWRSCLVRQLMDIHARTADREMQLRWSCAPTCRSPPGPFRIQPLQIGRGARAVSARRGSRLADERRRPRLPYGRAWLTRQSGTHRSAFIPRDGGFCPSIQRRISSADRGSTSELIRVSLEAYPLSKWRMENGSWPTISRSQLQIQDDPVGGNADGSALAISRRGLAFDFGSK